MKYEIKIEKIDNDTTYGKALSMVVPGTDVLECGPATGHMTKYMKEQLKCHVSIIEIDPEMYHVARQHADNGICTDLMDDEWVEYYKECRFDTILCMDVLEHTTNPIQVVKNAAGLLKDNGFMIVSLPNICHNDIVAKMIQNRWEYTPTGLLDDTHVHFWGNDDLDTFFKSAGLTIVKRDAVYCATGYTEQFSDESCVFDEKTYDALTAREIDGEIYQFVLLIQKTQYVEENKIPKLNLFKKGTMNSQKFNLRELNQTIKNQGGHIDQLIRKEREYQAEIGRLNREGHNYLSEIVQLQQEKLASQEQISDFRMKEQEYLKNLEKTGAELIFKIDELEQMRAGLCDRTRELEQTRAELNDRTGELEKTHAALRDRIGELEQTRAELDDRTGELEQTRAELNDRTGELKQTRAELDDRTGELEQIRAELDDRTGELEQTCIELSNKSAWVEQLLQSEREKLARIEELEYLVNESAPRKIFRIFFPSGTRRRYVFKMMLKTLRHPIRYLGKLNAKRFAKLLKELKNGEIQLLDTQTVNCVYGTPDIVSAPVEVLQIEEENEEGENIRNYESIVMPTVGKPIVSVIIPVYNQFHYTYLCLKSIALNSGDVPYEVILADDCSTDLTRRIDEMVEGLHIIRTEQNLRFLRNCNNAAKFARGDYVLFLNNDTQAQKDWLRPLVDLMERDEHIGMVGSKLIYPDGRLQEAGGILWNDGSAWNYGRGQDAAMPEYNYVKDVDYISGASIMIRRRLWEQLGGFDERFAPAYCEDSDLAFAVRKAGYRVVYQPKSVIVHFEGVSNGTDTSSGLKSYQVANQEKFFEKWKDVLQREHKKNAEDVFHARDRTIGKKTLLFVDHYVPTYDKDAGSRTVFAYIRLFVQRGFHVVFIGDNFYQSEPYTTVLQQMGVEVLYGSWYANHWKEWVKANAAYFDYAFLNRPHIAVSYMDFLKAHTHARIVYYGHDLHFLRMRREYALTKEKHLLEESEYWRGQEFDLMSKADMAYYPSEVEVQEIHREDPAIRVKAIPAYIYDDVSDVNYCAKERENAFFIGGFGHTPNVDAVKFLAAEIMPLLRERLPELKVHIVGSNMPEEVKRLEGNGLVMEGAVSDERLTQLYHEFRLCIVPLRYGAGIKGKVIESMRYGLPVVTTSCGAEGILGTEDFLIRADSAQEIADAITALYGDEARLRSISQRGIEYIRGHFSQKQAVEAIRDEFDL